MKNKKNILIIICFCFLIFAYSGQKDDSARLSMHFQFTTVTQDHNKFNSPYQGKNSLQNEEYEAMSITSTLFLSYTPIKNLHLIFNPELAGGKGLSSATGIAGFANGECFRIGNPTPTLYIARYVVEYYINIGDKEKTNWLPPSANQASMTLPKDYIKLFAGKFSMMDYFEKNSFNQDPRIHFLNWSFMTPGAWDYAADTRGYTKGIGLQITKNNWTNTFAATQLPQEANGLALDNNINKAFALQNSIRYDIIDKNEDYKAHIELIAFYNKANMGNYAEAIKKSQIAADLLPDISSVRSYNNYKYGFAINTALQFQNNWAAFLKLGYNDGRNETWAFTEIDNSANIGLQYNPKNKSSLLKRVGSGISINSISEDHKTYLAQGGYGFMIGDGGLRYGLESIFELYCLFSFLNNKIQISPDYQFIINPAYNQDRGPVNVIGLRTHVEF